jgi:acetylornithine deacetylase/succinyl-diaminopimelate desuccinylase-like protein
MTVQLVTYGPITPQHSGHYGNYVPNPALRMAQILGSMKSDAGRVLLVGFYDGVTLDTETRNRLTRVPDDEPAIKRRMGIAETDEVGASLQEAIQYPSLNIRGLSAGWVNKQARTIIPATAIAELDIRLVKESNPQRLLGLLRKHIESLGYTILERAPTAEQRLQNPRLLRMTHEFSYGAFRSDFDAAPGLMARAGLQHLYGEEPILIRTMGGSIPIAPFVEALELPAAIVPTVNIDNNQHSPNENLRLGNFIEGIAMMMSVLGREP